MSVTVVALSVARCAPAEERRDEKLGCAARACYLAARLLHREIEDAEIRECFGERAGGSSSYEDIATALRRLGLSTRFARLDPGAPALALLPFIAIVRGSKDSKSPDHFLVLYGRNGNSVQVLDFPFPPRFVPCSVFARAWDGSGLYVARSDDALPHSSFEYPWLPHVLAAAAAGVVAVSVVFLVRGRRIRSGEFQMSRAKSPRTI
jgi:ABC-type bacteriocin/lantibiotic exporter with double-glycine peptidase domain